MSSIPSKIPTSGNAQERIVPKKDSPEVDPNAQELLLEYLANNSDEYRRVRDLRKKVHPHHSIYLVSLITSSVGLGEQPGRRILQETTTRCRWCG